MVHHGTNIGPTWAQHRPKMAQHGPNTAQHRANMCPTYPQQHGTYIYIYDFIMFYWNFGANTPVRAVVVAKRPENTERERGISVLMNIYTEKEREGYQF